VFVVTGDHAVFLMQRNQGRHHGAYSRIPIDMHDKIVVLTYDQTELLKPLDSVHIIFPRLQPTVLKTNGAKLKNQPQKIVKFQTAADGNYPNALSIKSNLNC
jgi:hypothetical protein